MNSLLHWSTLKFCGISETMISIEYAYHELQNATLGRKLYVIIIIIIII